LSCATTKRVLDTDTFNSYQKIGITPYIYSNLPNDLPKSDFAVLTSICDSMIITNLRQLSNIKEIIKILADTLYTRMHNTSDTAIYEYANDRKIDVLLFCDISYQKYSYMFIPTIISETRLYCIDVKTRKTVIDFSYNNKNDVGVDETYESTTKQSVIGAINYLIKALNKN
jgi:hypothetical protein